MKMINRFFAFAVLASAVAHAALPSVDDNSVSIVQNSATRGISVSYTLTDGPAIIIPVFLTNGVPIAVEATTRLVGDVNRIVQEGERSLVWFPDDDRVGFSVEDGSFAVKLKAYPTNRAPDVVVFDLAIQTAESRRYYPSLEALPYGITNDIYKTTRLVMKKVRAAGRSFRMGAPAYESLNGGDNDFRSREIPRRVTFTNDWYLCVYPLTQLQMRCAMGDRFCRAAHENGVLEGANTIPASYVSYTALRGSSVDWPTTGSSVAEGSVIDKFRDRLGVPSFDLPTSARWEYSCRAGTQTAYYTGGSPTNYTVDVQIDEFAWYSGNSGGVPHPTGLKRPNNWGFYDMMGNVQEWVLDWYITGSGLSDGSDQIDPPGPVAPKKTDSNNNACRTLRGSGFGGYVRNMRVAFPGWDVPGKPENTGFRLMCGPEL